MIRNMAQSGNSRKYWVGVDLGGTKILTGIFDERFNCLGREKVRTKPLKGWQEVTERIVTCVMEALEENGLTLEHVNGIGVGSPGSVRAETGAIRFSGNLGWNEVPLQSELTRRFEVPVFVENDCNVASLGIYEVELGAKPENMLGIFLGTGIGGGLILNRRLYTGRNHTAGEFGHMVIDMGGPKCSCGNRGCFEAFASRQAIFRKIQSAIKKGHKTVLTDLLGSDLTKLRSRDLRKAIKKGDELVQSVIEEAAGHTGIAIANLLNAFNPEIVVLGGGLIEALEGTMLPVIERRARDGTFPGAFEGVSILASKLSDDAGISGAAILASQKMASSRANEEAKL